MTDTNIFSLEGRVALVTGGAIGLGFEIGKAMAAAGARVYLNGRSAENCARGAALIEGGRALPLAFDVADQGACDAALDDIVRQEGRLDILVNNVGERLRKNLDDAEPDELEHMLRTNVLAPLLLTRSALRPMKRGGYGRVIMMSSTAALLGSTADPIYGASKAALLSMARMFAAEMGPWGGTCNTIVPGPFRTERNEAVAISGSADAFVARTALGRWGKPHEIGAGAVFLASAGGAFVTGQALVIDGGLSAVAGRDAPARRDPAA